MAYEKIKSTDFAKKFVDIVTGVSTLYVTGGWGQPLTDNWKQFFISNYPQNAKSDRAEKILAADRNTFAFDCVCGVKSVIDGFSGDPTKQYGGAIYGNPCPDITIAALLSRCTDVSAAMSNIQVGEFVVYGDYSHCGVYVGKRDGKRMVAECTYRWKDGFQLVDMDCDARKGLWKYHGKLTEWVDYTTVNPNPSVDTRALKDMVTQKVKAKKGDRGSYVAEIQKVLILKGYPCGSTGADGDFGNATEQSVKNFQTANKLTADGIVGYDTITRLIGV